MNTLFLQEMAGLLSMLFEWYKVTATLPNDKSGAVVEKIKSDFLPPWLRYIMQFSNLSVCMSVSD